mgnify:CR=1 FL=1
MLGAEEPLADAETIEMVWALLDALSIEDRELRLNTVGDATCRPRFREALTEWLTPRLPSMCEDCRRRAVENPLRVFDCKVEADRKILEDAPDMQGSLCAPCATHFDAVRGRWTRSPFRTCWTGGSSAGWTTTYGRFSKWWLRGSARKTRS